MFTNTAETDKVSKDTSIINTQLVVSDNKDGKELDSDHKLCK